MEKPHRWHLGDQPSSVFYAPFASTIYYPCLTFLSFIGDKVFADQQEDLGPIKAGRGRSRHLSICQANRHAMTLARDSLLIEGSRLLLHVPTAKKAERSNLHQDSVQSRAAEGCQQLAEGWTHLCTPRLIYSAPFVSCAEHLANSSRLTDPFS